MPRNRKRTTNKAGWSSEQLDAAIKEIQEGGNIRRAARYHGIPFSTLQKRYKSMNLDGPRMGCKAIFTKEQEMEMTLHLKQIASMYYGLTVLELRKLVFQFAEKLNIKHKFNKESRLAGRDWVDHFLKRNPSVSIRKPEGTSLNRLKGFCKEEVTLFFNNLEKLQEKHKFAPHRIFNMDETGFTTVPETQKIIAPKGQKRIGIVTSGERGATTTVICCMNAAGGFIPPFFIFARARMAPALSLNGPPGAVYTCSKNGWTNEDLFIEWLKHFKSHSRPTAQEPVLLILDNHGSHITLEAYNYCRENSIIMLSLPPHSSHRLQPLDVVFFGPLKVAYNREVDLQMKSNPGERVTVYHVAGLFNRAYSNVATISKGLSGFSSTGIYPINPNIFSDQDFPLQTPVVEATDVPTQVIIHPSPSTTSPISFSDISPLPSTSFSVCSNYRKMHSTILTETPQKEVLEKKASRKKDRESKKKIRLAKRSLSGHIKRKKDEASSGSEAEELPKNLCEDSSEDENWQPKASSDTDEENVPRKSIKVDKEAGLNVGDYIMVTVSNDKLKKDFPALITKISQQMEFHIKFMRQYRGSQDIFVFPDVDDTSVVQRHEIVGKLAAHQKLRYGKIKFS